MHKTKMFPYVKNGVNFCAKPHTHTMTVRDYVILSYMENPVHLLILSLRQLILDHLEILCTSRVDLTNGMNNHWRKRHLYTFS